MAKTLEMKFALEDGKAKRMTLADPRADITAEDVRSAMEQMVSVQFVQPKGVNLAEAKSALVRETSITELF